MIECLICVALPCEARPLIDQFRLKANQPTRFRCYSNEKICLVETGIGKLNAASATAATLSALTQFQSSPPLCLNIGIAGADKPIGSLLNATSIEDCASGKKWDPQQTWNPIGEPIAVQTVDKPQSQYSPENAFDMEAAGVTNSAIKYMTLEFIQCLKVVSDNLQNPISKITPEKASKLIEQHAESIDVAINRLLELYQSLPDSEAIFTLTKNLEESMHFSATQRPLLHTALHQYRSCFKQLPELTQLMNHNNASALINSLNSDIASAPRLY